MTIKKHFCFLALLLSFFLTVTVLDTNLFANQGAAPPDNTYFFIKSVKSGKHRNLGYWDQSGKPRRYKRGTDLKLWARDRGFNNDQRFKIIPQGNGWYYIRSMNGGYVDVSGAKNANGVRIQVWSKNKTNAQKFRFKYLGGGKWKIYTRWGRIVASKGKHYKNGTVLHTWHEHRDPSNEWYFINARNNRFLTPGVNKNARTHSPPKNGVYRLQNDEHLVFGKIGFHENGNQKYTFIVVRKSNSRKTVYKREFQPYQSRPIGRGGKMSRNPSPRAYDRYDYYIVFNGKKYGPYDRFMEMRGDDRDIDNWVSRNGSTISFTGVRGQMYRPVIAGKSGIKYWSATSSPVIDAASGKNVYAIRWGNTYRVYDNGRKKMDNLKFFEERRTGLRVSDNGRKVLYVASPTGTNEQYIYLNHSQLKGPFKGVSKAGFIPGTSKYYYIAYNRLNSGKTQYDISIAGKKIPTQAGTGYFLKQNKKKTLLISKTRVATPKVNNRYAKTAVVVRKYDNQTGQMRKFGTYYSSVFTRNTGEDFYFMTFDMHGNVLIVDTEGKINTKVLRKNVSNLGVKYKVSSNNDVYVYYRKPNKQGGSGTTVGKYHYVVLKNGKPFTLTDKPFNTIRKFTFDPSTGMPTAILENRETTISQRNEVTFLNGHNSFTVTADLYHTAECWFGGNSGPVYWLERYKHNNSRRYNRHRMFINTMPVTNMTNQYFSSFTMSPDGKRFAYLMGNGIYSATNASMHKKYTLFVDGKKVTGKFGQPAWSKQKNSFVVLQEKGGYVTVTTY